jgi:hypothetical protein
MGRPLGFAKTGGRKRGTPNKSTQAITESLAELGCDPIAGMARIAMDPDTSPELKVRCYAELAQYVYPKRKPVDLIMTAISRWKP